MLNMVLLTGRLAADPQLRYTPSGVAVVNFTLAVAQNFKREGADQPEVDFIDCVAWKELAEHIANYFTKGKPMTVREGRLQKRSYEDNEGNMRYVTEVVVSGVDFALSDPTQEASNGNGGTQQSNSGRTQGSNSRQSSGNSRQGNGSNSRAGSNGNGNGNRGGGSGQTTGRSHRRAENSTMKPNDDLPF